MRVFFLCSLTHYDLYAFSKIQMLKYIHAYMHIFTDPSCQIDPNLQSFHGQSPLDCKIGLVSAHIHQKAINIAVNFRQLFEKYAKCHQKLNSNKVFDRNGIAAFSKLGCLLLYLVHYRVSLNMWLCKCVNGHLFLQGAFQVDLKGGILNWSTWNLGA